MTRPALSVAALAAALLTPALAAANGEGNRFPLKSVPVSSR
jgi:hypothetical protein